MQAPPTLNFDSHVFEVAFHPTERIVASGLITGDVIVHAVDHDTGNKQLHHLIHHKKSCRALLFSDNGKGACLVAFAHSCLP